MGLIAWIKELFNKFLRIFNEFINEAFSITVKMVIAQLKDSAVVIVTELASQDFSNEEKRAEALKAIKEVAVNRGILLKDSVANTLIELALQYAKKMGDIL